MRRFSHFLAAIALATLMALTAMGCNTVRGAGRDIEKGGEAIQDAAAEAQK